MYMVEWIKIKELEENKIWTKEKMNYLSFS